MTLAVVARLLDLPQAQVTASALRSAGLHPVLMDETLNYAYWTIMFAVGGCRIAVPQDELADAVAILEQPFEPSAEPAQADRIDTIGWGWRTAAGVLGLGLLMPELGWLLLGVRSRQRGVGGGAIGVVVAMAGTGVIFAIIMAFFGLMWLLANPRALG